MSENKIERRYQILDWDTEFFEIKVAKIIATNLNYEEMRKVLSRLARNGVKLVYFASEKKMPNNEIKNLGGCLVDRKTTFSINLNKLNSDDFISTDIVKKYDPSMPANELEKLSIQSGKYSRYSVDQNIKREKFEELYTTWIKRSIGKEIADEVLVILDGGNVAGMITLGNNNDKGDIGLLAVESKFRGKKYGERLVRAAQKWFVRNGYEAGQVVTQGDNIPASNLYKKCGYNIDTVEYYYHFWL
jgi:dTDP-4-amino-4,6-dideoxy-D-galactose acyltransferase